MTLPLKPPIKPQLALTRKALPEGEQYVYEVKLDGFRCLAFVDGEEIYLQSRPACSSMSAAGSPRCFSRAGTVSSVS